MQKKNAVTAFGEEPSTKPGTARCDKVSFSFDPEGIKDISGVRRLREDGEAMKATLPPPAFGAASVPVATKSAQEIVGLPLGPRAAFLFTQIDGRTPVQTLVDVTGMSEGDVLEILAQLVALRAIALE